MSSPLQTLLLEDLRFARARLLEMVDGFPEERATFQSAPTDCHLLWTLGHLALTDIWMMGKLREEGSPMTSPEGWGPRFGFGSVVAADPSAYPALAAVREVFERTHDAFVGLISQMDDAALMDGAPGARSNGHLPTAARTVSIKVWHEGWHAGQLSSLRKALGLSPALT